MLVFIQSLLTSMPRFCMIASIFLCSLNVYSQSAHQYLPENTEFMTQVPTPEHYLGFGIGERHIRHDQVLAYLTQVADNSERVTMKNIGRTTEFRSQVLLTISSRKNLANIDNILARRGDIKASANDPLVVWLGYSVHGDEISGTNASLLIAYYLAAAQNQAVKEMLDDIIVVIEPSINPDGMDRFVNWVSTYRGVTDNADPNHIEHHQQWRTGRTNHFGFDLNRDWLLLSQQESKNRLPYFHLYQPNVLGDFHEMGTNSTYFFQPGIASRTHPITPKQNIALTKLLATFHAKALDDDNRLYYSQESFDDFYYGKGSTYPDINGGIGVLFEQASSRGYQQNSENGLLTFQYGIQNHVLTSLSTLQGAWKNQDKFKHYREDFYKESMQAAKDEDFVGYVFSEQADKYRLNTFINILKQHQIKVFKLNKNIEIDDENYQAGHSYYVPLKQRQYRVVKALFNQQTNFPDNTFYDVSGWTLPLAMNIRFNKVESTRGLKTTALNQKADQKINQAIKSSAYAYAFRWHDFTSPKLLYKLTTANINAKVATKTFSATSQGKMIDFAAGTILIPAATQQQPQWQNALIQLANDNNITLFAIDSGLTVKGIDLGSRSFQVIKTPKVLLIGGKGVSQYESADILYYFDNLMNIPVTVVEKNRLNRIDFADYSHVIMVDGKYSDINNAVFNQLKAWLQRGGVVVAQKGAASWLAKKQILAADFVVKEDLDQLFDTQKLTYKDKEALAARKRIAGAIFSVQLDTSHPLAYGYQQASLPVFKNSTLMMESNNLPFVKVAQYHEHPLQSGYTDQNLVNRIANSPMLIAHNIEQGRVIASTDNLAFRGYFYSSMKILSNSLFFAKAFNTPKMP